VTQSFARPTAILNLAVLQAACSDLSTALTAGTGKQNFAVPHAMTVYEVRAHLVTAQVSGNTFTVDINQNGQSILSTKLTIDNGETTSTTAAVAPVIIVPDLEDDATLTVDIDQIGNGTAAGLTISIIGVWQFCPVDTLNDGIVAFWPLGEASGNALDSVGGNTLTSNGAVGQAAGIGGVGHSRSFNGSSQYFNATSNTSLRFGNVDWTMVVWIYTTDLSVDQGVFDKGSAANSDGEAEGLFITSDGKVSTFLYHTNGVGSTEVTASTFGNLSANTWYMFSSWFDATNQTINVSINAGTVDSQGTAGAAFAGGTADFLLGSDSTSDLWKGRLQYAGKWRRILTQTELTQLYNSGAGKAYPFS